MSDAPTLGFPESLSEKYQPKTVTDFIGLAGPKTVLSNFVAQPYPSAWLFTGESGKGKTTMALAMAEQIGAELKHVPSRDCTLQMVTDVAYHCHYMPWAPKKFWLILVDESNEMTPPAQDAWLSKLDATDKIPNTVIVFTTNDTYRLAPRFQSRCRVLTFNEEPTAGEVVSMLRKIWHLENHRELPEPDFEAIVLECAGNYRSSLMKLELALLGLRPPETVKVEVQSPQALAYASRKRQRAASRSAQPSPVALQSTAVASFLSELETKIGKQPAAVILQKACRAAGQRLYVDGKIGHVTIKAVNRVPEPEFMAALQAQAVSK